MSANNFCTVSASTKRNPPPSGGIVGAATTNLASLLITPLWPMNQEIIQTLALNSPREFKQCYCVTSDGTLPDIMESDILVIGANEYPVYWVGEWIDNAIPSLHIVVQEIKQNAS